MGLQLLDCRPVLSLVLWLVAAKVLDGRFEVLCYSTTITPFITIQWPGKVHR